MISFMNQNPSIGWAQGLRQYEKKGIIVSLENIAGFVRYKEKLYSLNKIGAVGAICRIPALKEVGGFDPSIRGAGEDAEVTARIKLAGWNLATCSVKFYHCSRNWRELWKQYFWYGQGMYATNKKHRNLSAPWKNLPLVTAIGGFFLSLKVYKTFGQKIAFLLPVEHAFKGMAWSFGYLKAWLS